MIGFIRTLIKKDKEEDSFCFCLGLLLPQHKHHQPSETQDLFGFCWLIMFMTQQEASGPSPAGRKPEQLLPKTFGSTFHLTKGGIGATSGPQGAWFLFEKF